MTAFDGESVRKGHQRLRRHSELCKHTSARKVEEPLAARLPRPDVRDLVRLLPAQSFRWRDT